MDSRMGGWGLPSRVSPFRNLRITGYVPLPAAYRSLSRLSSALSAKASALCPYQLNQPSPCMRHSVAACRPLHLSFSDFPCTLPCAMAVLACTFTDVWLLHFCNIYSFSMQFSRYRGRHACVPARLAWTSHPW